VTEEQGAQVIAKLADIANAQQAGGLLGAELYHLVGAVLLMTLVLTFFIVWRSGR